ncbi:MAG TPA: SGNH/GDSL hydrolase family protein [Thermomicrobiales bacterium]
MGFWIVISLVVLASIAVIIAVLAEADESRMPRGRATGPIQLMILGTSASTGTSESDPSWVERLCDALAERVRPFDATAPGMRLPEGNAVSPLAVLQDTPDIAVIWIGPDDFLAGLDLGGFERGLGSLLTSLAEAGARIVILDLPDLVQLVDTAEEDRASVRAELRRWNATISRLAAAHRATLIAVHDQLQAGADKLYGESPQGLILTAEGHELLAELVRPAVERLLAADTSPT